MSIFGHCDVCNKPRFLTRVWACGIETFACMQCRGLDPADYDEDETTRPPIVGDSSVDEHDEEQDI